MTPHDSESDLGLLPRDRSSHQPRGSYHYINHPVSANKDDTFYPWTWVKELVGTSGYSVVKLDIDRAFIEMVQTSFMSNPCRWYYGGTVCWHRESCGIVTVCMQVGVFAKLSRLLHSHLSETSSRTVTSRCLSRSFVLSITPRFLP